MMSLSLTRAPAMSATRLEGIVSRRRTGSYHAARCDWVKVKTPEWKEANKDRGELFGEER
jgi:ATP-dependent DNA ligase